MLTVIEKWETYLGTSCSVLVPKFLSEKYPAEYSTRNLYVNASVLPRKELVEEILALKTDQKLVIENQIVAFHSGKVHWEELDQGVEILMPVESKIDIVALKNTWDIVPLFATAIESEKIRVGNNVKLGACILNASDGEIIIDDDAEIMDGAMVKGPVYLGKHSCIKMGAKLYGPVAIGQHCKVGGEVSNAVFQAYSNKGHDGFLGHSYLGEWCNLGADTNTSNLKNNYDPVRLWNYSSGCFDRTGMQFLGLIMGDHSKTGINTMLNTGTVIGVACNVYGGGFLKNFVPDFCIGSSHRLDVFPLKKVYAMANAMMARRKMTFTDTDKEILKAVFNMTIRYRK